eukprot:SAG31_NODE_16058_length_725_cov_0.746006_1_plen_73_part_01
MLSKIQLSVGLTMTELMKELERALDCKFRYKKHMKHNTDNKCEDCKLKKPSFGMPEDGKMRWCKGCSVKPPGA